MAYQNRTSYLHFLNSLSTQSISSTMNRAGLTNLAISSTIEPKSTMLRTDEQDAGRMMCFCKPLQLLALPTRPTVGSLHFGRKRARELRQCRLVNRRKVCN